MKHTCLACKPQMPGLVQLLAAKPSKPLELVRRSLQSFTCLFATMSNHEASTLRTKAG
jgi:hypothetical protein